MPRRREFDFDAMLGKTEGQLGTGDASADKAAPVGPVQDPENTEVQEPVNTGIQGKLAPFDQRRDREAFLSGAVDGGEGIEALIASLIEAHKGIATGTAKKATFDFTPEFARALKRWSADEDIPMRDLVLRAVATVMPRRYLQEYRNPGTKSGR